MNLQGITAKQYSKSSLSLLQVGEDWLPKGRLLLFACQVEIICAKLLAPKTAL
jgi:hypothetical protein